MFRLADRSSISTFPVNEDQHHRLALDGEKKSFLNTPTDRDPPLSDERLWRLSYCSVCTSQDYVWKDLGQPWVMSFLSGALKWCQWLQTPAHSGLYGTHWYVCPSLHGSLPHSVFYCVSLLILTTLSSSWPLTEYPYSCNFLSIPVFFLSLGLPFVCW